jgi:FHS family glucose/mannose:H+ symporter-like MFS transporter
VTEFTLRRTGVTIAQAALSTSAFFVGLAFSRYMLERITRRITPLAYVAVLLVVSAGTLVFMLVANTMPLMLLGALVMGFGCGPIFPTLIATGIQRFPRHATLVSSTLVSTGSAGGVVLPALTGILITRNPSGAWLLLAGVFVLIGLGWQFIRSETRRLEMVRP